MIFNKHLELENKHAFLSPSKHYWLNYDEETLKARYISSYSEQIGTLLHELACKMITYRIKVKKTDSKILLLYLLDHGVPGTIIDVEKFFNNFMAYVNDAIGFRMSPEVVLKYSNFCFGTADSIFFDEKAKILRIHDLKTGASPASMNQLEIYMALFCLEYNVSPKSIKSELRIYQSNEVAVLEPDPNEILKIMDLIKSYDKIIESVYIGERL